MKHATVVATFHLSEAGYRVHVEGWQGLGEKPFCHRGVVPEWGLQEAEDLVDRILQLTLQLEMVDLRN